MLKKIWLCKHSEDIPLSTDTRKFRVGMLADQLVKNCEVTWWTSDYNHYKKQILSLPKKTYNGVHLEVANVIPYSKNVSIKRIYNHLQIGKFFSKKAVKVDKPDLIYASMPTLDFAYRATKFARKNNIPIVVDIRDLWPDVFADLIPIKSDKKNVFLKPWNQKLKFILSNATAITAITEEYLLWALNKLEIEKDGNIHRVFPLGYEQVDIKNFHQKENERFTITFIGTVGYHFDLKTIFEAAQLLKDEDIDFLILGDGDLLKEYKAQYQNIKNIKFKGHVSGKELQQNLINSDVGIAPYYNTKNFKLNVPNKPYEYLAYGMPILSPLEGPTERLISENKIGFKYRESDASDLADKIKLLKENKSLYNEMKKNCIELFNNNFEKNKIYEEYILFLNKVYNNFNGKKEN